MTDMTDHLPEGDAGSEPPPSTRHQVLSDTGEPLFEIDIPHEWRYELSRSHRASCVKTTTLQPSGREVAVKLGTGVSEYEYKVLQFVWSVAAPSTMCPEPIAFFSLPEINIPSLLPPNPRFKGRQMGHRLVACRFIVMSQIPGVLLSSIPRPKLSKGTYERMIRKAIAWMDGLNDSLRRQGITNPVPGCFSDIDGRRCLDLPLLSDFVEFSIPETVAIDRSVSLANFRHTKNLKDLNDVRDQILACITRQDAAEPESVSRDNRGFSPTGPQPIRFCHMNIDAFSIMIVPVPPKKGSKTTSNDEQEVVEPRQRWQFAGLVDWEYAGWYTARLEAYAGIYRPYFHCCTHFEDKGPNNNELSYVEIEADKWSADVDLAKAACRAKMTLRDARETDPYRRRSVAVTVADKALQSASPPLDA